MFTVVVRNIYSDEEMELTLDNYDAAFSYFEICKFVAKGTETLVDLIDATTGEVIMTNSEDNEPEIPEFDDEVGFNPYLGAFDFDC